MNVKEDRNKYLEGGSIIPMQSNSVCSNKSKGEVVSVTSETSACKCFDEDHMSKIEKSEKNIYLVKYDFSDGSFKTGVPVEKDVPLINFFMKVALSEKDSVGTPYYFQVFDTKKVVFLLVDDIIKTFIVWCFLSISSVT